MEKKTILLVEDDRVMRRIITCALEKRYMVLGTSRYSEAIEQLGNPVDLALLDYCLPDRNGLEVLKALKEVRPALPAIMITGYSHEDLAIKALRAGVTDYIRKPLCLVYLKSRISEILDGSKVSEYPESVGNREECIMDGIALYIEDNYHEDLTRDKLAGIVCMDRYRFSKVFNGRFGRGLKSYVNSVRTRKAAELLRSNELTVAEVAFSVGYGSIQHFNRVFKQVYGISPEKYRENRTETFS